MDIPELQMLISAIVLAVHAALAHIEGEQLRMEECDRLLLEYVGRPGGLRDEVSTFIHAAALHQLQSLNFQSGSTEGGG